MAKDARPVAPEGAAELYSPACSLGEVDPGYAGLPPSRAEVMAWRKETRARLIAARRALPAAARRADDALIAARLDALIGDVAGRIVSLYWPFRAEPDLRGWGAELMARGARLALPVVLERGRPLIFRAWAPGEALEPGIWNIPVPSRDARCCRR